MKKRTMTSEIPSRDAHPAWLPLDELAEAEISSEDPEYPIENALVPGRTQGWRAATPGEQIIRLTFEQPRGVKQVRVVIEEHECERTQQIVLRAALYRGGPWRELVRQQYNFSPAGAVREQEDYEVNLPSVAALELSIIPDINGGEARASLQEFRVAG
jgi:hypothetical protein